ncbi:MAG: ABC transporter permease [Oscillospiraceae bacterium]|nr:ABC transporter permease [Oscillospiraceae bacterium]
MFFKELYQYRNLLREIVTKNIKVMYRNSVLGMLWTLLQPLLTTLVLVFVFGYMFSGKRDLEVAVNFPIYLLCGRLLFDFYSQSTKRAMRSITGSASVIKKVRVPKYIYPLANIISTFITFLISLVVLVVFSLFFILRNDPKNPPPHITPYVFLAVVPLAVLFLLCTGVGLIISTISVFFKDVENLYDVFTLMLFYVTPIVYIPGRLGPDRWKQMAMMSNPMYAIIEMFRDCVLRGELLNPKHLLYSLGFALLMLCIGTLVFWRKQDKFILYI